jgi:dienelactone hydrolase
MQRNMRHSCLVALVVLLDCRGAELCAAQQDKVAPEIPGEYQTIDQLWAGIDPTAEPLDVQVVEQWSAEGIDYRRLYFTGEYWEGEPTRIYAIEGAPTGAQNLPGILHIHGGGQTANRDWVRFWAQRNYVGLSFDFCGDWRAQMPDRQEFTKWGRYEGNMAQVSGGRWMRPNARHNPWFHWALAARRAITLLQQHPACDKDRIGIHGTSVGGTLTWLVAGTDARVKAAVPIYGCGWNTYLTPDQKPEDAVDTETYAWRALLQPESYAGRIACPLLFLNATQDFHGPLDRGCRTMEMLTSAIKRQAYTPRYNHHIEPREGRDLPLWMDWHLKNVGGPWPDSPTIQIIGGRPVPQIVVTADRSTEVQAVEIDYALNAPYSGCRFWRTAQPVKADDGTWRADAPITAPSDMLYALANVSYTSGVTLSSPVVTSAAANLPGVQATLMWQAEIDRMESHQQWYYVPAYTDPCIAETYFRDWETPDATRCFTLNAAMWQGNPVHIDIATFALSDPQFRGRSGCRLLLDYWADLPWTALSARVLEDECRPTRRVYTMTLECPAAAPQWRTLVVNLESLRDDKNQSLADWSRVSGLELVGTAPAGKPPAFRHLRWESAAPAER